MKMEDNKPAGSHHGHPDLLMRDIYLLEAYTKWVETVRKEYNDQSWLPGPIDWRKSRLFWRIRSGKEPLPFAPPTCFSCPWYEVIELDYEEHTTVEEINIIKDGSEKFVSVAQCRYKLIKENTLKGKENAARVSFGPYVFDVWNDVHKFNTVDLVDNSPGTIERRVGFIKYIGLM